jgi:hypothetical protein
MKKIYLLGLSLVTLGAFAQRTAQIEKVYPKQIKENNVKTPTDTLWGTSVFSGPTFYSSQNGGYVFGVNGYGDFQKAQQFLAMNDLAVEGAVLWFGAKEYTSAMPSSKVVVWVADMSGTGTTTAGSGMPAPGTPAQTADITIANLDTVNFNFVNFTTPYFVSGGLDFSVGIDLRNVAAGETTGLVSSADGTVDIDEMSWEQWNDNTWHTIKEAWQGLNVDLAIFPIVDNNAVGIEEAAGINGVKFTTFPNPAVDQITITYNFANAFNKASVEIYTMNGKLVVAENLGNVAPGTYNTTVNTSNFAKGTYFVAISADGNKVFQKVVVK